MPPCRRHLHPEALQKSSMSLQFLRSWFSPHSFESCRSNSIPAQVDGRCAHATDVRVPQHQAVRTCLNEELQRARRRRREFWNELFGEGGSHGPIDGRRMHDEDRIRHGYSRYATKETASATAAEVFGIHNVVCRVMRAGYRVRSNRGARLRMCGHCRHFRAWRRRRRVATPWQPGNQKTREEFRPEFHEIQYRLRRSTSLRRVAGVERGFIHRSHFFRCDRNASAPTNPTSCASRCCLPFRS